jgi:hypothetical protein
MIISVHEYVTIRICAPYSIGKFNRTTEFNEISDKYQLHFKLNFLPHVLYVVRNLNKFSQGKCILEII